MNRTSSDRLTLRCACGAELAEATGPRTVRVDGREWRFGRVTDFIVCDGCGAAARVLDLRRAAEVERWGLADVGEPPPAG